MWDSVAPHGWQQQEALPPWPEGAREEWSWNLRDLLQLQRGTLPWERLEASPCHPAGRKLRKEVLFALFLGGQVMQVLPIDHTQTAGRC